MFARFIPIIISGILFFTSQAQGANNYSDLNFFLDNLFKDYQLPGGVVVQDAQFNSLGDSVEELNATLVIESVEKGTIQYNKLRDSIVLKGQYRIPGALLMSEGQSPRDTLNQIKEVIAKINEQGDYQVEYKTKFSVWGISYNFELTPNFVEANSIKSIIVSGLAPLNLAKGQLSMKFDAEFNLVSEKVYESSLDFDTIFFALLKGEEAPTDAVARLEETINGLIEVLK